MGRRFLWLACFQRGRLCWRFIAGIGEGTAMPN
jgi:hypothetical protein